MKARTRGVLAHDPGVSIADFFYWIARHMYEIGIPLLDRGILMRHPIAHLHQRLLNVPRLLFVVQIFRQLLVGKMPPKPGVPPEQERHENDQPTRGEEQYLLGA